MAARLAGSYAARIPPSPPLWIAHTSATLAVPLCQSQPRLNTRRRKRTQISQPLTPDSFQHLLGITLDPFQVEAIEAFRSGRSVLVAAPTGTGKTAVAEFAVLDALQRGARALYTTPIKALSNQKYRDFDRLVARLRESGELPEGRTVGLLTGDIVLNPDADLLIMTTEVLRNMLVQDSPTPQGAGVIVFDEVHYMGDRERGTAWEESILLAPPAVPLVCLSATVPNADVVAEWIRSTKRELALVEHAERAVPLEQRYFVDGKLHLTIDGTGRRRTWLAGVGGELARNVRRTSARPRTSLDDEEDQDRQPEREPRRRIEPWEVLRTLDAEKLTPAIYFLFSRRACEEAAESCFVLPQVSHGRELVRRAKARLADLAPADRALRQIGLLLRVLPRGVAIHHAGLLPVVKMLVEELFAEGLLRAVFATDTLAVGINMPARTVVIGEMSKWDGEQHRLLTPNEHRQMSGRAGRRGIDERGVVVSAYSPWVTFEKTMAIATGELLPLDSAFSPSYSTAANLWRRPGDDEVITDLYLRSFRRFQQLVRMDAVVDQRDAQQREFERQVKDAPGETATWELARELAQTEQVLTRARSLADREVRDFVRGLARVLERFGYLADDRPTPKSGLLRSIFDTNSLPLAELISTRRFEGLDPAEVAEVCSWFTFDRDAPVRGLPLTPRLRRLHEEVCGLVFKIAEEERRARISISRALEPDFKGVALAWCGGTPLADLARVTRLAEGDLVGLLQKTLDVLGQLKAAVEHSPRPPRRTDRIDVQSLAETFTEADALLRRGVVEASYRWAIEGVPDAAEADADWIVPEAPPPYAPGQPVRRGRPPRPPMRRPGRGRGR
ncbi:MAG: DEAD/DEAH box helicase [Chloroflexota bacterium]